MKSSSVAWAKRAGMKHLGAFLEGASFSILNFAFFSMVFFSILYAMLNIIPGSLICTFRDSTTMSGSIPPLAESILSRELSAKNTHCQAPCKLYSDQFRRTSKMWRLPLNVPIRLKGQTMNMKDCTRPIRVVSSPARKCSTTAFKSSFSK